MKNEFKEIVHLDHNTVKSEFCNIQDFKLYWEKYSKKRRKEYNVDFSENELIDIIDSTVNAIEKEFTVSDRIIHYDNFSVAPERCGREFVLLANGNNIKKSVLIRMS
jgi:restriction endonuclease